MQPNSEFNIVEELSSPAAYLNEKVSHVEVNETHISWIFLTDCYAYKVKKPVQNQFIDYSTLERRHHFCLEEVRLDQRYALELYVGVVPICTGPAGLTVGEASTGTVCEYAVKMHRFPAAALLAERLAENQVESRAIVELGGRIADFHVSALPAVGTEFGEPELILREATDNFDALMASKFNSSADQPILCELQSWTQRFWATHQQEFKARKQAGFVRECHGDLHAGNIVDWRGTLTPFDGIEFNPSFHWIDILSDAAFLAMDLIARGHEEFSRLFVNAYLERIGDYHALALLRWYMIYRAMVRAKVAEMVMTQHAAESEPFTTASAQRTTFLKLAQQLSWPQPVKLWITHGLSGSGKSTVAEAVVRRWGAVRIRSDVERKRMFEMLPTSRPHGEEQVASLYSSQATEQTYSRLRDLAENILNSGYCVVIDATFLKRQQRQAFSELAERLKVPFAILSVEVDMATLEQRLLARRAAGQDPSDADVNVLHRQFAELERLNADEEKFLHPCVNSDHG